MNLSAFKPSLVLLMLTVPHVSAGRTRFIQECVGFQFSSCTDSGSSFVLGGVTANDSRISDSFYSFVEVNSRCRQGSYTASVTGNQISGAGQCSDLNLQAGVISGGGGGSMCNRCSFRRRLDSEEEEEADEVYELSDNKATSVSIPEECNDMSYTGYLHVDDHLTLLAVPSGEAVAAQCPFVAAHVVHYRDGDNFVAVKEAMLWHDAERGQANFDEPLAIGTFSLSTLRQAVENAEHSVNKKSQYNILTNNCAIFALDVANKLNISVTKDMTAYVTRRLVAHSSVVSGLREAYDSFIHRRHLRSELVAKNDMDDNDFVQLVVEGSVSGMFSN